MLAAPVMLNYGNEIPAIGKTLAVMEKHLVGRSRGGVAHSFFP